MQGDSQDSGLPSLDQLLQFRAVTMAEGSSLVLSADQIQGLSPTALAYIGDAVYELFVRGFFLWPPKRINDYHRQVVNQVRAERQADLVQRCGALLSEAEHDILRRGRNASSRGPRRIDGQTYQRATGFETLIGYLYLTNPVRLGELLTQLDLLDLTNSQSSSLESSDADPQGRLPD